MSEPELNLDYVHSETGKVSDLISMLRFTFRRKDFDRVENILADREKKLNDEIGECKQALGVLAERVKQLEKDNGACHDKLTFYEEREKREGTNNEKLLEDFRKLERKNREKVAVYEEREKRMQTKYKKLSEDFERSKRENWEMAIKSLKVDSARVKAETELERVKKKNKEFLSRVTQLEEDVELMMSHRKLQPKIVGEKGSTIVGEKGSTDVTNANRGPLGKRSGNSNGAEVKEVTLNGHGKGKSSSRVDSVDTKVNQLKKAGADFVIRPCDEGISIPKLPMLERGDSSQIDACQKPADGKTETKVIIEIMDSDDEMLLENQNPNERSGVVPDVSIREKETKKNISENPNGGCHSMLSRKRKENECDNVPMIH